MVVYVNLCHNYIVTTMLFQNIAITFTWSLIATADCIHSTTRSADKNTAHVYCVDIISSCMSSSCRVLSMESWATMFVYVVQEHELV